jgi:integrase/recombinase XerD
MKVTLRKTKISDTKQSLFLDIAINGERKKEYLKLHLFIKPKDTEQRQHNQNTNALADKIRIRRESELLNSAHGFSQDNYNKNFIHYFEDFIANYKKANVRMFKAVLNHLKKFLENQNKIVLPGRAVTVLFCEDFAEYLKAHLNFETPLDYFKTFKQVLRRAKKQHVVSIDLDDIVVKFNHDRIAIRKPILNQEEIIAMMSVAPPSPEIARAYVVSLNTGLDYATLKRILTWEMIDGDYIVFDRSKTKKQNRIKLNDAARAALGEPKEDKTELVFNLPTWNGCVKSIRKWAAAAGVHKKITWHSARHTLGDMLINDFNVNPRVAQEIFGHSDLKPTIRYTRVRSESKDKALDQLPAMQFNSETKDK